MQHKVGNLIQELKSGIILHQVNCQGKMNSGFAKELRAKYPAVFAEYTAFCAGAVTPSDLLGACCVVPMLGTDIYIANVFGQLNYGYDGRRYTSYDALDDGLGQLKHWMLANNFSSSDVHHPLLGSDRGGACWGVVAELIKHRLGSQTTLWTLEFQERL